MKFAKFLVDGEMKTILAKNVSKDLLDSKPVFFCPECGAESFYRRESLMHRPCFFSLKHTPECMLGTSDRNPRINTYRITNISVRNDLLNAKEVIYPPIESKGNGGDDSAPIYYGEEEPEIEGVGAPVIVSRKETFKDIVERGRETRTDVMVDNEFTVGSLFINEDNLDDLRNRVAVAPKILFLKKINPKHIDDRKLNYHFAGLVEDSDKNGKKVLFNVKVHDNWKNNNAANRFFISRVSECIKDNDAVVVLVDRIEFVSEDAEYLTLRGEINNRSWLLMKIRNGVETFRYVKQRNDK